MARARSGDLGRRVVKRRREMGLTREDVALQAGMNSGYLDDHPAELEQASDLGIEPWPGGRREALLRIETETISGLASRQAGLAWMVSERSP